MSMHAVGAPGAQRWPFIALMVGLTGLALAFLCLSALPYADFRPAAYGEFWPRRFALAWHILGGVVALTTGLIQVWLGVTGRTRALHRALGRVYLGGVAVGASGGFYLAATSLGNPAYATGLFFLATAWSVTTGIAWLAIHRRLIDQHREWMLRSYTVTFAFVSFRLATQILISQKLAPPAEAATIMAWACWSVPLLVAEPLLQMKKLRRR